MPYQYLPLLIDKVEKICEENGLRNDSIVMRMTGCPNGCARPYVAGKNLIPPACIGDNSQPVRGRIYW
jgi:sulfite reductase beta subunit-like hemoprotein